MDAKDQLIEQLFAQNQVLQEANDLLRIQVRSLEEKITTLEKNSSNSSKPPSSDIVKPQKDVQKKPRKKRKPGGQPGHRKFSRTSFKPDEIDYFVEYEFGARDAVGLQPLDEWQIVQQISLPEKLYRVTEHQARKYLDPKTGKIHVAPLPTEVLKGGLLAADLCAMVGFLKGSCHMSYSTIPDSCTGGNIPQQTAIIPFALPPRPLHTPQSLGTRTFSDSSFHDSRRRAYQSSVTV